MTASYAYCTYFDSGYLARGLALFESLASRGDTAEIWVLCLDDETKTYLDSCGDARLHTITTADIEAYEPRLLTVKSARSRMEYIFTCTPQLVRFVQAKQSDPTAVAIYLDADLYFFDDPAHVVGALETASVGIIEHRYPRRLERRLLKYGRFNVGWVGFRNDENGRGCADWWAESCLDWCYDTPEDGRYADQGYLDEFPTRFDGVRVLSDAGFDLAPWNTGRHTLTTRAVGNRRPDVLVDGRSPLAFFHFHGLRERGRWFVTSQLLYHSSMTSVLRKHVYQPYVHCLDRHRRAVRLHLPHVGVARRGKGLRGVLFGFQRWVIDLVSIASGNAIRSSGLTPPS
ncbi:MAG: hypothetical protein EPN48_00545 [Microbacteriaceae bacterium]|nr:MAG: hypothetical protein EPN48_00545 [Microbacteriaceae bacterium]